MTTQKIGKVPSIDEMFYISPDKVIVPPDRIRKDIGDLTDLKASITQHRQIHPVLLDQRYTLISGFRRLTACKELEIPVLAVRREDLSDTQMMELELMENLARLDLHWVDAVRSIKKLHDLKCAEKGRPGATRMGWRFIDTAAIIGRSEASVQLDYNLARALEATPELTKFDRKSQAAKELKVMFETAVEQEIIRRKLTEVVKAQNVNEALTNGVEEAVLDALPPEAHEEVAAVVEQILGGGQASEYIVKAAAPYGDGDPMQFFLSKMKNADFLLQGKEVPSESIHLVVADPPYGIDIGESTASHRTGVFTDKPTWPHVYGPQLLRECYRVLVPNAHMYLFLAIEFYDFYVRTAYEIGFDVDIVPLVWVKGNYTGRSERAYEIILYLRKGNPPLVKRGRSNVLIYDPVRGGDKIHATEKPVPLLRDLISRSAYPEFVVLDPMAGSGSTLQAAYELGLEGIGYEQKADNHAKAIHRLAEWGKEFYNG